MHSNLLNIWSFNTELGILTMGHVQWTSWKGSFQSNGTIFQVHKMYGLKCFVSLGEKQDVKERKCLDNVDLSSLLERSIRTHIVI